MKTLLEAMYNIKENKSIECYRTIGQDEFFDLVDGKDIIGRYSNSSEEQNTSNVDNVVCFFKKPILWLDKKHEFTIKCLFKDTEVADQGQGKYYASSDFSKTNVWTGKRGKTEYNLDEVYVSKYNIDNVVAFIVKEGMKDPLEFLEEDLKDKQNWLEIYNKREQEGQLSKRDQKDKTDCEEIIELLNKNISLVKSKKIIKN